jgi:hypothetical protein
MGGEKVCARLSLLQERKVGSSSVVTGLKMGRENVCGRLSFPSLGTQAAPV